MRVVVVGDNSMAQALSRLLLAAGSTPTLLGKAPEGPLAELSWEPDPHRLLQDELVFITVPSHALRATLNALPLGPEHRVVVCARGPEPEGGLWPCALVSTVTPALRAGVLAGPLQPEGVLRGDPAAAIIASAYAELRDTVQRSLHSKACRVYLSEDVVGVELAAAFARALTVALGVAEGMGMGAGVRGLLMSRGLAEARRLGLAMKGQPETFTGLAGLGDLVASASDSRDPAFSAGMALLRGEKAQDGSLAVAEALLRQANRYRVDLPLTEAVVRIGQGMLPAADALRELMRRDAKSGGE